MGSHGNRCEGHVVHQLERLFSEGSTTGLTEGQLLDRFATNRDGSAFEALVDRHGPMVLGVCRQFLRDPNDVDDAFQATFLVLVRKAGSLRRKELVGNWLYGVANRVAIRARSDSARRQARMALAADVDDHTGIGRSKPCESGPEAVLRAEDRPLLLEEVNRLPHKYRTPIVLCYFEGLTHDEAAATLGWPVGTVKGRLSRARDLLRTRLSRRGVTVSSAALLALLPSLDLRAAVPVALTQTTINVALAVAASGAAVSAASTVSLSVASLTEGVIQAMFLSQAKSLLLPVVVAAGVLTTGASVVAFQLGGRGNDPRPRQTVGARLPEPANSSASTTPADGQDELQLVRRILGDLEKLTTGGERSDPDAYRTWSLRLLEAENSRPPANATTAAYEGHSRRMSHMLQLAQEQAKAGQASSYDVDRWKFYAREAQLMLDDVRHSGSGGNIGMMSGRMGGGTGGAVSAPAAPAPEQPPQAPNQPPAQQPQPQQQQTQGKAAANEGGGGFGGGGLDGDDEGASRITIARISAIISTLDKNPKNQALTKKLDEPMSLHFAVESPLEDVLKRIKDSSKGSDGKPIPIYVDPVGLQEAEKTLKSPVTIDLADVPLRFSLRLLLKQLGMAYCVHDGVLIISSVDGIKQELLEAQAEQMGLNPERFKGMMGGFGGGMGGMGGMMGGGGMM
jgi:RNA polymerase sigma factor (sigma-70 family)